MVQLKISIDTLGLADYLRSLAQNIDDGVVSGFGDECAIAIESFPDAGLECSGDIGLYFGADSSSGKGSDFGATRRDLRVARDTGYSGLSVSKLTSVGATGGGQGVVGGTCSCQSIVEVSTCNNRDKCVHACQEEKSTSRNGSGVRVASGSVDESEKLSGHVCLARASQKSRRRRGRNRGNGNKRARQFERSSNRDGINSQWWRPGSPGFSSASSASSHQGSSTGSSSYQSGRDGSFSGRRLRSSPVCAGSTGLPGYSDALRVGYRDSMSSLRADVAAFDVPHPVGSSNTGNASMSAVEALERRLAELTTRLSELKGLSVVRDHLGDSAW